MMSGELINIRKVFSLFIALLLVCALSGCTTAAHIKNPAEFSRARSGKDSSLVFGRIQWIEKGEEKKLGKGILTMSLTPHLFKLEDKSRTVGEISENGNFVWTLSTGTYLINKIAYRDTWSGNYLFVPKVAFRVPENGKIYYAGTLKAEFDPKRDIIGGLSGKVRFSTWDTGDTDLIAFQNRFNMNSGEIEKSLMVHDSRLPQTLETTDEFNLAVKILNAILYGLSQ